MFNTTLQDFIKIYQEDFLKIPINTYIKWETQTGEIAPGGVILFFSKSGHWKIKMKNKEVFLSLDRDFVYIIKPLFYDYFNDKLLLLSSLVKKLSAELGIKEEFMNEAAELQKEIETKTQTNKISIFEEKLKKLKSKVDL